MPKKITARYARISGHTSSGTRRKVFRASRQAKASTFSTSAAAAISTQEAHTASRSPLPESLFIPLSEPNGKQGPAAHAQSQQDGDQEGHQRKRGAYGRQRVLSQKLSHNQGVCNIVALLQKVSQNHGHRKQQHGAHHRPPGQVFVHVLTLYLYSSPIVPPIAGRTQACRRSFPASLSLPRQVLLSAGAVSLPPQKLQSFPAPAAQAAHRMPMAGLPSIDCTRGDEPWLIPTGSCWRG